MHKFSQMKCQIGQGLMENSLPIMSSLSLSLCSLGLSNWISGLNAHYVLNADITQQWASAVCRNSLEALFSQLTGSIKYQLTPHRLGYNVITETIITTNIIITVAHVSAASRTTFRVDKIVVKRLSEWRKSWLELMAFRTSLTESEKESPWIICHISWQPNNKRRRGAA